MTFEYASLAPVLRDFDRLSLISLGVANSSGLTSNWTCSRSLALRRSATSNSTLSSSTLIESSSTTVESLSFSEQANRFFLRLVPVQYLATFLAITSPSWSPAARLRIKYEGTVSLPCLCTRTRPCLVPPLFLTGNSSLLKTSSMRFRLRPTFFSMPSTTSSIAGLLPDFFPFSFARLGTSLASGKLFWSLIVFARSFINLLLNSSAGWAASATIETTINSTVARFVSADSLLLPEIFSFFEKSGWLSRSLSTESSIEFASLSRLGNLLRTSSTIVS